MSDKGKDKTPGKKKKTKTEVQFCSLFAYKTKKFNTVHSCYAFSYYPYSAITCKGLKLLGHGTLLGTENSLQNLTQGILG